MNSCNGIFVLSNTSHNHYIYTGGTTGEFSIEASEEFRIRTNSSERMRIDSSGTIIGTGTYSAGSSIKIF